MPTFHPVTNRKTSDSAGNTEKQTLETQISQPMLNIGVWGWGPQNFDEFISKNRDLEHKLTALGGRKWLYAHTYYQEARRSTSTRPRPRRHARVFVNYGDGPRDRVRTERPARIQEGQVRRHLCARESVRLVDCARFSSAYTSLSAYVCPAPHARPSYARSDPWSGQ